MGTLALTGTWTALRNTGHGMAGGDVAQDSQSAGNVPGFRNVRANASPTNVTGEFAVIPDELLQYLTIMCTALNINFWTAHSLTERHLQSLRNFGAPSVKDESGVLAPIGGIATT